MTDRLNQLQQFFKESPNDPFLIYAITLEYVKLGDTKKAREGFETLISDHPNYVGTYYHFAKFLENAGEADAAVKCYENGIEVAKAARNFHALGELQRALQALQFGEDEDDY